MKTSWPKSSRMRCRLSILAFFYGLFLSYWAVGQGIVGFSDATLLVPLNITHNAAVWIDTTGQRPFDKVSTAANFLPLTSVKIPRFLRKEVNYSFWIRLKVKNEAAFARQVLLTAGNFYETTLYELDKKGTLTNQWLTSQRQLPAERLYRYDYRYFPLKFNALETKTLYLKIRSQTGKPFEISPQLYSYEAEAKERVKNLYDDYYPMAVNHELMAVLAFLAIFFLFQWFLNRQRYLLFYSFYLISVLGFAAYGASFSSYVVHYFSYLPFLRFTLQQNFYILLTLFAHTCFLYEILGIKHWSFGFPKRYFRGLLYLVASLIALELFLTVLYRRLDLQIAFHLGCQILLPILNVVSLTLLFVTKERISWFIKLGALVMVLGTSVGFASSVLGWVPMSSALLMHYPNVYFNYGVLIDILFFSLATGEKMMQIQHERNQLMQNFALSELTTLRTQINPHFLFNSLNSIKSYIIKNKTDEAAAYLTDFSVLMREILEKSREQFLSLAQELTIINQYLQLEQRRFSQPFRVEIHVAEGIDSDTVQVPAFLLQPFVENSIKHGFKRLQGEGQITIKAHKHTLGIEICIEDNGIGRDHAAKLRLSTTKHRSMGLTLVENRLRLLREVYHWDITLRVEDSPHSSGTRVILLVPSFE
jgi:two-component sensor histidine kinase